MIVVIADSRIVLDAVSGADLRLRIDQDLDVQTVVISTAPMSATQLRR